MLQVGNGGTTGSIAGNVLDNFSLVYDLSGSASFPGVITGSGGLSQAGPGVLVLPGSNVYTGATTVFSGTLQVGSGGSGEFLASPSVTLGPAPRWYSIMRTLLSTAARSAAAAASRRPARPF